MVAAFWVVVLVDRSVAGPRLGHVGRTDAGIASHIVAALAGRSVFPVIVHGVPVPVRVDGETLGQVFRAVRRERHARHAMNATSSPSAI